MPVLNPPGRLLKQVGSGKGALPQIEVLRVARGKSLSEVAPFSWSVGGLG